MAGFEPIAVVGTGVLLPGCHSLDDLVDLTFSGGVALGGPPSEFREGFGAVSSVSNPDRIHSDRGGFVRGFGERFDPDGFEIERDLVRGLDPLFQWILHTARAALREASIAPDDPARRKAGIVLGNLMYPTATHTAWANARLLREMGIEVGCVEMDWRNRFSAGLPAQLAAKALGLGGRSYCLDAACASSLYAVKIACDRLQSGQADVMLAGGVNCSDPLFPSVGFSGIHAISPTGKCRPFSREADGILPGQGAAVVALRRLSDASSRGDRILGVIRGIGLSNDGRSGGFFAPSVRHQIRCMREAYAHAGIEPEEISYLECHATGTRVGDSAEIAAVREVFGGAQKLTAGALKANIGHLVTASGAAALVRVLGSFREQALPPTPGAYPLMDELDDGRIRILSNREPWDGVAHRRAAINGFGFGGNNAHLVVEEWRADQTMVAVGTTFPTTEFVVVGLEIRTDRHASAEEFAEHLLRGMEPCRPVQDSVSFGADEMLVPPRDMQKAHGRQLLFLRTAIDALGTLGVVDRTRLGVFAGVGSDPESERGRLRWTLDAELAKLGRESASTGVHRARDALAPATDAASFLGSLANITANRINNQLDSTGVGFVVAAEEISGVVSLELACESLRRREIDIALVGAVDTSRDQPGDNPMPERSDGSDRQATDAVVVMVLMRLDDARRQDRPCLATVDPSALMPDPQEGRDTSSQVLFPFARSLCTAHAVKGLLDLASAVICANAKAFPFGTAVAWPGSGAVFCRTSSRDGVDSVVRVGCVGGEPIGLAQVRERAGSRFEYPLRRAALSKDLLGMPDPEPIGRFLPPAPDLSAQGGGSGSHAPWTPRARPPILPNGAIMTESVHPAMALLESVTRVHETFLERMSQAHSEHLRLLGMAGDGISVAQDEHHGSDAARQPVRSILPPPSKSGMRNDASATNPENARNDRTRAALSKSPLRSPPVPEPWMTPTGPSFSREELELLASGKVSRILGSRFAPLDDLPVHVRMPMPPLLLCDQVLGIEGEPLGMGKGRIWTRTVVREDSWYLGDGRMPAGVFIESGQADLLLVSWLGIDARLGGRRVYRLLGADVTFLGPMPVPGDVIDFQITGDGFARQGENTLFFFRFDGLVNGAPRVLLRNGQAGFFRPEDLQASGGLLWDPEKAPYADLPRLTEPVHVVPKSCFDVEDLRRYRQGDFASCFGAAFAGSSGRNAPVYRVGAFGFFERVPELDHRGGPRRRGYARATAAISPEDWCFQSHFKDDPCMPGTLMIEACIQLAAFYMASMGLAEGKDGWIFEPVDATYSFRCRGQISPDARNVAYELFVDEVVGGPCPTIFAHVLGTVDGRRSFGCERLGIRLVPARGRESADPVSEVESLRVSVGRILSIDPRSIEIDPGSGDCANLPFNRFDPEMTHPVPDPGRLDVAVLRRMWNGSFDVGPSPFLDLIAATTGRFVRRVVLARPDLVETLSRRPVLFLANHQTGIESLEFMAVAGALNRLPIKVIAKQEHRTSFLGRLLELGSHANPGNPPIEMFPADRENQTEMLGLFREISRRQLERPFSLLVHVEGTRSMRAAKPVERLSGMLLDLAIRHDLLVVPVRFVGGLPREEIGARLEFPFGYGTQDIHIGAPLYAGELAKLPYGERSTVVVSALNALGPEIRQETPNPADPEFARRVQGRMESARMPEVPAAIVEALLEQDDLCDDTREVLAHLRDGTIARSESARRILSLFSVAA